MNKNANVPQPNQVFWRETTYKTQKNYSKLTSLQTTGKGLEESAEFPERTMSYEQDQQKIYSRTSSDLMHSLRHSTHISHFSLISANSNLDSSSPTARTTTHKRGSLVELPSPGFRIQQLVSMAGESSTGQKPSHRRRKSIIVLDPAQEENALAMKNITQEKEPQDFFEMSMFQQKIWQRIMGLTQTELCNACLLEVLVNAPHEEYEMTIDVQNIPYNWNVIQLAKLINEVYARQKGTSSIQKPQLSMLVGRIKTQRIEQSVKVFELINMVHNRVQLLVLEEKSN